jgi:hypothetical protein
MSITYLIYEAERPLNMTEQREADARAGEFAAAVARLGHSLRHPALGKSYARRGQHAGTTVPCPVPRPRQPVER